MGVPPYQDGIFASWEFIQWSTGCLAAALAAILGLVWRIGRKVGGFERSYAMLESRIESDRVDAEAKATADEARFQALEKTDRSIEKAVNGLPAAIIRIEDSLRDMTRRIDEILNRPGRH